MYSLFQRKKAINNWTGTKRFRSKEPCPIGLTALVSSAKQVANRHQEAGIHRFFKLDSLMKHPLVTQALNTCRTAVRGAKTRLTPVHKTTRKGLRFLIFRIPHSEFRTGIAAFVGQPPPSNGHARSETAQLASAC